MNCIITKLSKLRVIYLLVNVYTGYNLAVKDTIYFKDEMKDSDLSVTLSCWRSISYRNQSTDLESNGFYMIGTSIMKELKASGHEI